MNRWLWGACVRQLPELGTDRKSTRLNSSHQINTLSLHDALPIYLMSFFLRKYAEAFQRPVPPLSAQTGQLFDEHTWPGNLVELEAFARAIVAVGDESVAMGGLRSTIARAGNGTNISLKEAARAASREAEKELILKVLNRTRWNRRRAAQELHISYKALLYKLKQIGYGQYGAT